MEQFQGNCPEAKSGNLNGKYVMTENPYSYLKDDPCVQ
jgi:hypothetical protein